MIEIIDHLHDQRVSVYFDDLPVGVLIEARLDQELAG
jgi:hypothetical protein